jgi:NAD(P)-dependent dehydrogenase (short-subunit alcohol dehydrogenase family)
LFGNLAVVPKAVRFLVGHLEASVKNFRSASYITGQPLVVDGGFTAT